MLEPTETDPHLRIWAHLLLVPSFTWSIPPTCFKLSEHTKLNSILGALPYFLGSPAMHWKDGGCMSASLPMSFEVRGFFQYFLSSKESPRGLCVWRFPFLDCSAWVSAYMHASFILSRSQFKVISSERPEHPIPLLSSRPALLSPKLWIHWFVYFFTVSPFPHHESRNSAFVTHQYNPSAYSKSWSIGSVL